MRGARPAEMAARESGHDVNLTSALSYGAIHQVQRGGYKGALTIYGDRSLASKRAVLYLTK